MAIVDITKILNMLEEVKVGLADLAYALDSNSGELEGQDPDEQNLAKSKEAFEQGWLAAKQLHDKLALALAAVASLTNVDNPLFISEHTTLSGYNFNMAGAVHRVAGAASLLMVTTQRARGYCACDATGTCAAHAEAFNELLEAEQHLTKAAKAFVNANGLR